MSLWDIIDWSHLQQQGQKTGTIASPFYEYYDASGNFMWACDVDIGESMTVVTETGLTEQTTVLQNVPVASNNWELLYAQQGQAVSLNYDNGRWTIIGLSKTSRGLGHIILVTFAEDVAQVASDDWVGLITRPLTFGELGTLTGGGFGSLPFGAQGRFTKAGVLVQII